MVSRDVDVAPATTARQDGVRPVSGEAGDVAQQDNKKLVVRSGATATDSDFDIVKDTDGTDWDLNADGDFTIPGDTPKGREEAPNVGGTVRLGGGIVSASDATFEMTIDWIDENDNVLLSETFGSSTNTDFGSNQAIQFDRLWTKSDFVNVTITDTSGGTNNIHGSLNFHA
jgi:hypothetical protein